LIELIISGIIFGTFGFCVGYYKLDIKFWNWIRKND